MLKIIGINDEVTTCECCGRSNLKKTVVLSTGEGEVRYGTECAANALGKGKADVEKEVRSVMKSIEQEKERQRQKEQDEWMAGYETFLLNTYGDKKMSMDRLKAYRQHLKGE